MNQRQPQRDVPLAVCSWSLRPADAAGLRRSLNECGLAAVQLHLNPLVERAHEGWSEGACREALRGVAVVSGMMSPLGEDYSTLESIRRTGGVRSDATWEGNRQLAERMAGVCAAWGIGLVTLHAGFVPPEGGREHEVMVERVGWLARCFGEVGTRLALETGQEAAATLMGFLKDVDEVSGEWPRVGVNFDPANMVLYGMGDPVAALRLVRARVVQVHIKDAVPSATAGEWGEERVVGEGSVAWREFFEVLKEGEMPRLVIEREAGEAREADVRRAVEVVRGLMH
ncbi:MAG: sugar phosphate isomerase/epimerase family protein [Phycisphaerales bacterium]